MHNKIFHTLWTYVVSSLYLEFQTIFWGGKKVRRICWIINDTHHKSFLLFSSYSCIFNSWPKLFYQKQPTLSSKVTFFKVMLPTLRKSGYESTQFEICYYLDAFYTFRLHTWQFIVYRGHNNWYIRNVSSANKYIVVITKILWIN